ncbi:MAG TPA: hypothetical protein VGS00_11390 [Thermoanaerobaculia bacterium]|nr:hypothetical protein [Thermoanaerobaculia bacterium]
MTRTGWRPAASVYLVLFFVAVAAAPHHHLNGLEDLLLDQRSDSGVLTETPASAGTAAGAALYSFYLVNDIPCLACFTHDFFCAAATLTVFVSHLERLELGHPPADVSTPERLPGDTSSRGPPRLS